MAYQVIREKELPQANLLGWDFGMPLPEGSMPGIGSVVVPLQRGFDVPYHCHPTAEVWIFSIQGRAKGIIDGEEIIIEPFDVIFIPPGCPHKWETISEEDWISYAIHQPEVYLTNEVLDFRVVQRKKQHEKNY